MLKLVSVVLVLLILLIVGCAGVRSGPVPLASSFGGDVAIEGAGTANWPRGEAPASPNFVWTYETVTRQRGYTRPNHHMTTVIRIDYDPIAREVRGAQVVTSEKGYAFRHVCITPQPDGLLSIRMATLLDRRGTDLTVVKVHGPDPATHSCEEIGIGPEDGLVEGLDVLFKDDGTFTVMPGSNAYLAGSNFTMERVATLNPDGSKTSRITLPQ